MDIRHLGRAGLIRHGPVGVLRSRSPELLGLGTIYDTRHLASGNIASGALADFIGRLLEIRCMGNSTYLLVDSKITCLH